MIWFKPPYAMNVSQSVSHQFLKLLDKCFDKSNPLHKILNRHTVKVSYRTTPNLKKIIASHNAQIQTKTKTEPVLEKKCNWRSKNNCSLQGQCLENCVVYQATVTETETKKTDNYIGLTADPFKTRYNNHTKSFNNRRYETDTELSKHIWKLKDAGINYTISWKIVDRGRPFNPVSKTCHYVLTRSFTYWEDQNCVPWTHTMSWVHIVDTRKAYYTPIPRKWRLKPWSTCPLLCSGDLYFELWLLVDV